MFWIKNLYSDTLTSRRLLEDKKNGNMKNYKNRKWSVLTVILSMPLILLLTWIMEFKENNPSIVDIKHIIIGNKATKE